MGHLMWAKTDAYGFFLDDKISLIFDCNFGIIFLLKYISAKFLGFDEKIFKISDIIIGSALYADGFSVCGS
jgi:hypothetical protein